MTRQDAFFRSLAIAAFAALLPCAAFAQDVPPPSDAQLQAPGAAAATPQPQAQPADPQAQQPSLVQDNAAVAQPQTQQQEAMPDQPDAVRNASTNADPCPTPEAAGKTPDDLAKVQEDIDRFTLCVQRAQLLERLNESLLRNMEAGDAALGLQAPPGVAGAQRAGGMGLPPLPASALAGADVSPVGKPGAAAPQKPAAADAKPQPAAQEAPQQAAAPAQPVQPWTIREIYSAGGSVEAKLISPEGDEVRAKSGQQLPDGKTTVVRVTPAGVTIKDDGGMKPLDWAKI